MHKKVDFRRMTQVQYADMRGVDVRTVRRWVEDGHPTNDDGTYDSITGDEWRAERLSGGALNLQAERARLAKEQADKYARENAIGDGQVLELSVVEQTWTDLLTAVRARVLSLPTKLAAELAAMSDANRVRDRIYDEVEQILHECSQYDPGAQPGGGSGLGDEGSSDSEAPAPANGKRVGRRKPPAQS